MTVKESFKEIGGYFKEAIQLILINKKLVVYAAFFALAGGVFNLIRNLISLLQYLQFYNPFWGGFNLNRVLSLKSWLSVLWPSLKDSLSLGGLVGDVVYLSSANLISIGVLLAALFFSTPLKEFFRKNDFAWQMAFYSFGASMVFLPFFLIFSRFFKVGILASFFTMAEGVVLTVFLTILLTFFEAIFLYVIKFRLAKQPYSREDIFNLASVVFKPLFIFNLFWVFLNPINFSGLFSAPALFGGLAINSFLEAFSMFFHKILVVVFSLFSIAFIFVPSILIFCPNITWQAAMKKSLKIFKSSPLATLILFIFGLLLQIIASLFVSLTVAVFLIFGFGQFFEDFFISLVAPLFYATALLIFVSAVILFLNRHCKNELLEQSSESVGEIKIFDQ